MQQSFYGYNAQKQLPDDLLLRINPAVMMTFDAGYASHLCDLLPDCEVYYRSWTPHPVTGDDNLSNQQGREYYVDPVDRANFIHATCSDPRVWLVFENEPQDEANPTAHVDWQMTCATRLLELGRKVGIGKYGPGGPTATRPTDRGNVVNWQGALRPLAQLANDNPDRVRMVLDEYIFHFDINYGAEPQWGRYWYAGRFQMLIAEFPNVKVALGECGFDDMEAAYKGQFSSPLDPNKVVLSTEQNHAKLVEAWNVLYRPYPDNVVGGALFTYEYNDPGSKWYGYDFSRLGDAALIALADDTRMAKGETVATPETQQMIVTVTEKSKKRSSPGITGAYAGMFEVGTYAALDVSTTPEIKDGYVWHYFRNGNDAWWSAVCGIEPDATPWITLAPLVVEEPPDDPAPEPEPEPEPPTDDHAAIMAAIDALNARLDEMEAKLANHYRAAMMWASEGVDSFGGTAAQ